MKAFVISKVREKIGKNGKKFQKLTNLEEEIGRFCYSSLCRKEETPVLLSPPPTATLHGD